jgi:GNAT superfamily N-acetyltransferase
VRPPPSRRAFLPRAPHSTPEKVETLTARDGSPLVLRQIRANDVHALQLFFSRLTPQEVRMRFLHPLNELPEPFARELCELDPAVAFAWVLAEPDDPSRPDLPAQIHGVARGYVDHVLQQAEFGIVIEGRFSRQGFGTILMQHIIDSARKLGAIELWSDVFLENTQMLGLCEALGFSRSMTPHSQGVVRVQLTL